MELEKSKLEKLSDKILLMILKQIKTQVGEYKPEISDYGYRRSVENIMSVMGFGGADIIDIDFISSLYIKNLKNEFNLPLIKPKVSLYSIETDITTVETINRTYKHILSSYDISNVYDTMDYMSSEGLIDTWDGELVNEDVMDSYTDDETIDKNSIKKIK